jgi:predicted MFS family arabinose efflux permease
VLEPGPAPLLAAVLVPAAALAISWNGLVFTAAGELAPPDRAATAMAVSNTANYVGAAAAPPLGGLVAQAAGWPAMLALGAVAALGALVALHRLAEAGRATEVGESASARP